MMDNGDGCGVVGCCGCRRRHARKHWITSAINLNTDASRARVHRDPQQALDLRSSFALFPHILRFCNQHITLELLTIHRSNVACDTTSTSIGPARDGMVKRDTSKCFSSSGRSSRSSPPSLQRKPSESRRINELNSTHKLR